MLQLVNHVFSIWNAPKFSNLCIFELHLLQLVKCKGSWVHSFCKYCFCVIYLYSHFGLWICGCPLNSNSQMLYPLITSSIMDGIFCFLLSFLQFLCKRSSPRLWNARQGKGKLWRSGQQDHSWMSYKK